MRLLALLTVAVALLSAEAQSQTGAPAMSPTPTASVAAASHAPGEVSAAAAAIVAAFGRHDPRAYFALFAPEATFVFHTTPQRLNSRAEYQAEWAKWEKEDGFRVRSCKSSDQRVQVLGDAAVFTHTVVTEISTKQGPSTMRERETIVFRRDGGKWIAVHEHLSPLPESAPPEST
jgi:uncharacterized protein (TIGR02246 family)